MQKTNSLFFLFLKLEINITLFCHWSYPLDFALYTTLTWFKGINYLIFLFEIPNVTGLLTFIKLLPSY
ncbi:hypothetical protein J3Q64DRAFT_1737044 [Phycomyces blakesleeanus]|uniref:Uncharacterized protein n=1 Tax=Phycomyces blakesleeanus TaxID=4837 RepID=A0ABR3B2C9_PHYBL